MPSRVSHCKPFPMPSNILPWRRNPDAKVTLTISRIIVIVIIVLVIVIVKTILLISLWALGFLRR